MAKTNLTDEEKQQIIEAINENTEPPPELMPKLFPHVAKKYDVAVLDKAKIATLEYSGKRSEAAILNQTFAMESGSPLQAERFFKEGNISGHTQLELLDFLNKSKTDWMNLIVQGDNLQFLKTCYQNEDPLIKDKVKGKVKLVYIDPPFATKSDFAGAGDEKSYSDKVASAEFIEGLRERLIYLRKILDNAGTIYVHLDQKMCHYVKVIMDEVFGKNNFVNEIIWKRTYAHSDARQYGVIHDIIFYYSKSPERVWNVIKTPPDKEYIETFYDQIEEETGRRYARVDLTGAGITRNGLSGKPWRGIDPSVKGRHWAYHPDVLEKLDSENRIHWPKRGVPRLKNYADENEGITLQDVWTDIRKIHNQSKELLGYPTQKPEALLERIIRASSNPGDLIIDIFARTGTTAAVAEKLGRRWIVCDFGKHAIYTMQKRILRIAESKDLNKDVRANKKYGKGPQPFCVLSCGAYDFSRIMNLRENKDAYINFVLGLFQLPRDSKNLNGKYKLVNIYGEKDGHPVEVYPVWEDEYLKDIRIDEDYLKQILIQSGGKLRGDYYIITPETCTVIGDTILKNDSGKEVHFKLLKFPYKVLEEVSRNFQITEQPNSQENVNHLINASGFYFNDEVEIAVKKIKGGLKITKFKTGILKQNGEKFNGLEGMAMLLVDVNYDNNIFDMEKTVFARDINQNQEIKISGLTNSVAVIAIDKHGNESNPFILKD
jgi:DNA modification methylase